MILSQPYGNSKEQDDLLNGKLILPMTIAALHV